MKIIRALGVAVLLAVMTVVLLFKFDYTRELFAQAGRKATAWYYGVAFTTRPGGVVSPSAYITHPAAGYMNVSTKESTVGDVYFTGLPVYVLNDLSGITVSDQWLFAARADTDDAFIASPYDYILDSLVIYSTYGSGDTAIVLTYSVLEAGTVTQLGEAAATPDTLVNGTAAALTIDYTGLTEAQRTINASAGERLAIYLDEHGTLELVTAILFGRTYYVAD